MSKSSGVSDKLKVDDRLEEGFADALQHKLTDEDIARARELLGVYSPLRQQELYSVATADAIRNWAQGIGDDNPLFLDPAYGEKTRWGAQIGHGTLVGHIKTPMLGDPLPDEMKKLSKGLFRGVHVFVSGGRWEWFRPLYAGDRLFVYSGEESLEEKTSEFADLRGTG